MAVFPLPVSARFLPFFGSFPSAVSVSPSARLSCVFAPFPCVFWAFACLSCGYPLRRFHFNALFRPFTAFFRSARAIYQGNKKSPFSGQFSMRFRFRPFGRDAVGVDRIKDNKKSGIFSRLSYYSLTMASAIISPFPSRIV